MGLLDGKNALVFGVANQRSIAYGIASALRREGASLGLSYVGPAIQKRVEPIATELGNAFTFQCDVSDDESIGESVNTVLKHWDRVDIIIHSVAFAPKEALCGRYIDTPRSGFLTAMDISVFSLPALCKAYESLLHAGSSIVAMTYYGAQKAVKNYNVMGVAKAALESSVRYLALDLGGKGIRVNAISSGPVRTLASSAISGFVAMQDYIVERSPLHKNVTTTDVGNTAVFLASEWSSSVTGEILFVDCGYNIVGM